MSLFSTPYADGRRAHRATGIAGNPDLLTYKPITAGQHIVPAHTTQEEVMPYTRNKVSREPKSSKKKKNRIEPLQNVISLRINDDEKRVLEKLTKTTSKSISEIMREAIDLWSTKRRKLCMD